MVAPGDYYLIDRNRWLRVYLVVELSPYPHSVKVQRIYSTRSCKHLDNCIPLFLSKNFLESGKKLTKKQVKKYREMKAILDLANG